MAFVMQPYYLVHLRPLWIPGQLFRIDLISLSAAKHVLLKRASLVVDEVAEQFA